jgi:hypothetical protein
MSHQDTIHAHTQYVMMYMHLEEYHLLRYNAVKFVEC